MDHPNKRLSKATPQTTTTTLEEFLTSIANDDVLLQIFTRLPDFRSACQFAAVCKRWRSVISNPEFIPMLKRHRSASPRPLPFTLFIGNGSIILHGREAAAGGCGAHLKFLPAKFVLSAACKELLLLQLLPPQQLCLCNPLTRRWTLLPEDPPLTSHLLLEPEQRSRSYGFVFDPDSDQSYRVIVIRTLLSQMCVGVFRSEIGRWDECIRTFPLEAGFSRLRVTVGTDDGIIYTPLVEDYMFKKIAAFDPFDISMGLGYREVSLPNGFGGEWKATYFHTRIGAVKGRLRLWQFYVYVDTFIFKVWQLNRKNDDWEQVHHLRLATGDKSMFTRNSTVMALHPSNDDVFLFKDKRPPIWQYHIRTRRCKKIIEANDLWSTEEAYTIVHQPYPTFIPDLY